MRTARRLSLVASCLALVTQKATVRWYQGAWARNQVQARVLARSRFWNRGWSLI